MREITKQVRAEIKKELGFNSREVKVRGEENSIEVTLKSVASLKEINKIENIVAKYKVVRRDPYTQEVLSGGNIFTFVELDSDLERELIKKLAVKMPFNSVIDFKGSWEQNGVKIEKDGDRVAIIINDKRLSDNKVILERYMNIQECLIDTIARKAPSKLDYFLN